MQQRQVDVCHAVVLNDGTDDWRMVMMKVVTAAPIVDPWW